jgi:hypothetical protein
MHDTFQPTHHNFYSSWFLTHLTYSFWLPDDVPFVLGDRMLLICNSGSHSRMQFMIFVLFTFVNALNNKNGDSKA